MARVTSTSLFISLSLLIISAMGGAALTWKIAGSTQGVSFLYFGLVVGSVVFFIQLAAYWKGKNELFFQLFYLGMLGLTITWFLLCMLFPIFWINKISFFIKFILAFIFLFIACLNVSHGLRQFDRKWNLLGESEFERLFNKVENTIKYEELESLMRIKHELFVPGIPSSWSGAVGGCAVLFIIAGLNLRNIYPVFSVFAWGIPSIITASFFLQISGVKFAQAYQINVKQKVRGVKITSL